MLFELTLHLRKAMQDETVEVLGFAKRRAHEGIVWWSRRLPQRDPEIIEYGTHAVEQLDDGTVGFIGGEYFPAVVGETLEDVKKAEDAARRSFAQRAGLIPQEVES